MRFLDDLLAPLQQWLNTLEQRERHIVISGSIALLVMLFYLIIWEPIMSQHEQQQLQYESQRQLYSLVKNASNEIQQLNASKGASISRFRDQSISTLTDRSAITTGIKPYIDKLDQSKDEVKVTLKSADFDRIVIWLADLENKYGIVANSVKIEKAKVNGAVDAHITLQRSS